MRNIFLATVFFIFVATSCKTKTKEQIAKDNIKAYLAKTMNDFKSYEAVEFESLDSIVTKYEKTSKYDSLESAFSDYAKLGNEAADNAEKVYGKSFMQYKYFVDKGSYYDSIAKRVQTLMKQEQSLFKPELLGYKIKHTYRGTNNYGATVIGTEVFYLDTSLNVLRTEF